MKQTILDEYYFKPTVVQKLQYLIEAVLSKETDCEAVGKLLYYDGWDLEALSAVWSKCSDTIEATMDHMLKDQFPREEVAKLITTGRDHYKTFLLIRIAMIQVKLSDEYPEQKAPLNE